MEKIFCVVMHALKLIILAVWFPILTTFMAIREEVFCAMKHVITYFILVDWFPRWTVFWKGCDTSSGVLNVAADSSAATAPWCTSLCCIKKYMYMWTYKKSWLNFQATRGPTPFFPGSRIPGTIWFCRIGRSMDFCSLNSLRTGLLSEIYF